MAEDELDIEKTSREATKAATRAVLNGIWEWLKDRFGGTGGGDERPSAPGRGVLIIGAGGVGKTTLAQVLSGQLDWLDERGGNYQESESVEEFALSDDPNIHVLVAPGQTFRREHAWPGLQRQIAEGAFRGVILVSAYGYHSFSTPSYKSHTLWPTTGTKDAFRAALTADRRQEEVRVLRQLVPYVSVCKQKLWFLSVVTKQDLWAKEQGAVESHYQTGEYAAEVQRMSAALGTHAFRHDHLFVALTLRTLKTPVGEHLQGTASGGYDVSDVAGAIQRLVRSLQAVRAWEELP